MKFEHLNVLSSNIFFIRKKSNRVWQKLKDLGGQLIQHDEANEHCLMAFKNEWGLMFRACTVKYAKGINAIDCDTDETLFFNTINNLTK